MAEELPSDDKIKEYIDQQMKKVVDISTLTRTILKDNLAKKFRLSQEQRSRLDTDAYYKNSIKEWIQDSIVRFE